MSGPYDKEDAARETDVSVKEVSKTWHQAREDADRSREEDTRDWHDRNNRDDDE